MEHVLVMGFGTYDRDVHPRIGVIVDGLREHGDEVVEIIAPLGLDTAGRVRVLRQPWRLPLLAARVLGRWATIARRGLRTARRRDPDVVLVGYLGHFDVVLARLLFPRRTIVLDHLIFAADTATDRGTRGGLVLAALRGLDRLALACADVVVVDTAGHAAMVGGHADEDVVVVAVGASRAWFEAGRAARPPRAGGAALRVVFFGLFTPLHGTTVLARALALLAERGAPAEVLLIGDGQDHDEAVRLVGAAPGVRWSPWVEPAELPAVVAHHDVCLGIFGDTPKALRVVPNKAYQGLAAGCALVTSNTAPQSAALAGAAQLVAPGDPVALADALERLAHDPERVEQLRAAAARAAMSFLPATVVVPLRARLLVHSRGS